MSKGMMNSAALEQQYQHLWQNAMQSFHQNRIQTDENLLDKQNDLRRGMTLIIRPSQTVAQQISLFLAELAVAEPNQYFYYSNEFHLTLLSLFTATQNYQPYYAKQSAYPRAVDSILSQTHRFAIRFHGITASPGSVMIQGFPENDALNLLREQLRRQLISEGLGNGLDQRYTIKTAHITVFRFQQQPNNIKQFLECLRKYRSHDFGEMNVSLVRMVENDWYMTQNKVSVIKKWELV